MCHHDQHFNHNFLKHFMQTCIYHFHVFKISHSMDLSYQSSLWFLLDYFQFFDIIGCSHVHFVVNVSNFVIYIPKNEVLWNKICMYFTSWWIQSNSFTKWLSPFILSMAQMLLCCYYKKCVLYTTLSWWIYMSKTGRVLPYLSIRKVWLWQKTSYFWVRNQTY
jgi:hypothetical protein